MIYFHYFLQIFSLLFLHIFFFVSDIFVNETELKAPWKYYSLIASK